MKKIITFIANLGFWPYVFLFTALAVITSFPSVMVQSYFLTDSFFDANLLIVGFFTPLVNGFIIFFLTAFVIRYLVDLQKELTTSKEYAEQLLQEQKDLLSLFDKSDSVLFKWRNDTDLSIDYVSNNVTQLFGYSKDDFLNKKISYVSCVHEEDLERISQEILHAVAKNLAFLKHEAYRVITKDAQIKWVMDYTVLHRDKTGTITHFIGYIVDITQQKLRDEAERNKLQKFIDTQNNMGLLTDAKSIDFCNKTLLDFFGYECLEDFKKKYKCICAKFVEHHNFFHLGLIQEHETTWIESMLNLSGRLRVVSMLDKHGTPFAFSVSISKYDAKNYIVSFADISDTMVEKLELKKEASIDVLTNLYNRVYFNKHINSLLELHKKNSMRTGIIFFDIDNFKQVNDTYGHDMGDTVLATIALLVKRNTRVSDKIIRWGGEEFIVVCEIEKEAQLAQMSEHLRSLIESYHFKNINTITCSFGCQIHSKEDKILQTINKADQKLYIAKENGRNRIEC